MPQYKALKINNRGMTRTLQTVRFRTPAVRIWLKQDADLMDFQESADKC